MNIITLHRENKKYRLVLNINNLHNFIIGVMVWLQVAGVSSFDYLVEHLMVEGVIAETEEIDLEMGVVDPSSLDSIG